MDKFKYTTLKYKILKIPTNSNHNRCNHSYAFDLYLAGHKLKDISNLTSINYSTLKHYIDLIKRNRINIA